MDRQKLVGAWYCENFRFRIEVCEYKTGRLEGSFGAHIFEDIGDGNYRRSGGVGAISAASAAEALAAAENKLRSELAARPAQTPAAAATSRPPSPAVRFARKWAALLVLIAILIPVTLWPPYSNSPAIRSDGIGYHV